MGQFARAVTGIGDACRALAFPIVSGNVSLYNETNGRGILPTPTIGGVGLIRDWSDMARIGFAAEGQAIVLVGAPAGWGSHLGQSIYLRDVHGRADGPPPPVDLAHERKVGDLVRALIVEREISVVHDLSDGGLAIALAEMAMTCGIGATIDSPPSPVAAFFGEDQGRYLVAIADEKLERLLQRARSAGVSAVRIGTTGSASLKLGNARAVAIAELVAAHEAWFPTFMSGDLAPEN
jgi:phosphoribosylformylglycinamidine synthase